MRTIHLTLIAAALFFSLTAETSAQTAPTTPVDKPAAIAVQKPLTSSPATTSPIYGGHWVLETLSGSALRLPAHTEKPYIAVGSNGSLTGFGGCNQLTATAKVSGSSIAITALGATKMKCTSTQAIESGLMTALSAATLFKVDGGTLTLLGKTKPLATFVREK